MKYLYFDSIGGASGDMLLSAFADLGMSMAEVERDVSALPIGAFHIEAQSATDHGLRGTRVSVQIPDSPDHSHHHGHAGHHGHGLADMERIISAGTHLPEPVRQQAMEVFRRIAAAEARAHGTTPDQVHFHEVGAVDSLVDIVGNCLTLHRLGIDAVAVAPLPMGQGTITCDHGVYPSPAPATVELLRGFPISATDEPFELVTPTGAALLTTWKSIDRIPEGARLQGIGCGLGHHALHHRPNLLRAMVFTAEPASPVPADTCLVLECNLDDTTAELMGLLSTRLMDSGALDVFFTSIHMKKNRPGVLLSVLCEPLKKDILLDLIFRESTTLGVREYETRRTVLDRRMTGVTTPYGTIAVKVGTWKGQAVTWAPEMEDCVRAAHQHGKPVREVYEAAFAEAHALRAKETA